MNVSIYSIQPDGNCLYRALSHIIFGVEDYHELLKDKLLLTFVASPNLHFNDMQKSGILSEQELQEHINSVSERNAWGTNVALCMLGAFRPPVQLAPRRPLITYCLSRLCERFIHKLIYSCSILNTN